MNCNEARVSFIFAVIIVIGLLRTAHCALSDTADNDNIEEQAANGNLYDLFRKRLGKIYDQISWHDDEMDQRQSVEELAPDIEISPGAEMLPVPEMPKKDDDTLQRYSVVPGHIYDSFKQRLDNFNEFAVQPIEELKKKIDNCESLNPVQGGMYDELLKHIEKFTDLSLRPKIDYANAPTDTAEKRSPIRECLYEEYKKPLDKLDNEVSPVGEKVVHYSGRRMSVNRLNEDETKKRRRTSWPNKNSCNVHSRTAGDRKAAQARLHEYLKSDDSPKERRQYRKEKFENEPGSRGGRVHIVDEDFLRTHDLSKFYTRTSLSSPRDDDQEPDIIDDTTTYDFNGVQPARQSNGKNMFSFDTDPGLSRPARFLDDSYPAVLTKALESSLDPLNPPKNLLASVAEKMNMTTLDLAKKLTSMNLATPINAAAIQNDAKLNQMVQKYIESSVLLNINNTDAANNSKRPPKHSDGIEGKLSRDTIKTALEKLQKVDGEAATCEEDSEPTANISSVLNRVLNKLERIQADKEGNTKVHPEGAPCNVIGSWNSQELGLQFIISVGDEKERPLSSAEKNNKLLTIEAHECNPPKHHGTTVDTDWVFMGSSLKLLGGPFYIYSQKRSDGVITAFSGFCRTCGGIDTIFGSWTFLYPSKDCQDISASIENKRDILRRYNMDAKRKERFKDMLYNKSKLSKPKCDKRLH